MVVESRTMSMSTDALAKKKWKFEDLSDQSGKIIIVTGANSGLGFIATRELSKNGADVVMACRNLDKAEMSKQEILDTYPEAKLHIIKLDQSSLASIKQFTEEFKSKFSKLDVLLNNAGIMQPPHMKTEDGFEMQMGVNHLGHYALTGLLLDILKQTKDSRVVTVSSIAHKQGKINFEDLMSEQSYSRTRAYSQSKLANILFGYELHRKLQENGLSMKSVVTHPGYARTNLQKNGPGLGGKSFLYRIYTISDRLVAQSAEKGALSLVYACTEPDVNSGDFIGPGGFYGARGYPKRGLSNKRSYNEADAKKLWKISETLTKISFEF